jgi:acyl transferase domain-containing protein
VQFNKAAASCFQEGESPPIFLEVGPHPVLCALVHANAPPSIQNLKLFPSLRKPPANKSGSVEPLESTEWQTMLETLSKLYIAGVPIDFKQFHRFHPKRKVPLPFYPFQRKQFWVTPQTYTVSKKLLNPLLGSKVDSPKTPDHDYYDSTRQTRFQNFITLQTHGYVGDHMVGKFALLPGAGFIEAFLAATSAATVLMQEFPIILEDLVIKSPFLVENVLPRELHTVLTVSEEKFAKLTAFGRDVCKKKIIELFLNL